MKYVFFIFLVTTLMSCQIEFADTVQVVDQEYFEKNICILDVKNQDFKVLGDKPHIIMFYDDYVTNCRKESSVFNYVSAKYPDFKFYAINVSDNDQLIRKLGVKGRPMLPFLGFFSLNEKYQLEYLNGNLPDTTQLSNSIKKNFRL